LDRAIKTLNFNADIKALNTSIMVCHKINARKLWSDSPTLAYVTDVCESMLKTEWKCASDWIPHHVSQFRWLVIHHLETERSDLEYWSDKDDKDSLLDDNSTDDGITHLNKNDTNNKFGLIPCFSWVYEVKVNANTQVFGCLCCNQERMSMPCHHIALVCLDNETILGKDPKGFPLSSVRVFWWNEYYLYGKSNKKDHKKSKQALMALASNNTPGLPVQERLIVQPHFHAPKSFSNPITSWRQNVS
jgi:hypothetical protein